MRYAQRGGYTPADQQRREWLRLEAAGRFARGDGTGEIARDLRVMPGSVRRWRRAWAAGGTAALRSRGPVSRENLSGQQWARLEAELRAGFATEGYAQGTPELAVMRHGRWRSAAVMRGYVEEGGLWDDNAAARLGL